MVKYIRRKIAGVSIANPRRIMKKVARARAYPSLHCSDGVKDKSMKTPRSFADSTIWKDVPLAKVRGAAAKWEGHSFFPDKEVGPVSRT